MAVVVIAAGGLAVPTVQAAADTGPDLWPTSIKFDWHDINAGEKVYFDSGINNFSDTGTGTFNIKWLVNGEEVGAYGSHEGVPSGSTVMDGNSQFEHTFTRPGNYTVTFIVDVDNYVKESIESNNKQNNTLTVK